MSESETDAEFVERVADLWLEPGNNPSYANELARLFALARRGAAMQWNGIETAPKGGFPILLLDMTGDEDRIGIGYYEEIIDDDGGVWLTFWQNGARCNATMWMPLPPPPTGEK